MLKLVSCGDGGCTYVYHRGIDDLFNVVMDFRIGELCFVVFENGLWVVELTGTGKCLLFDGLEFMNFGE